LCFMRVSVSEMTISEVIKLPSDDLKTLKLASKRGFLKDLDEK